MVSTETRVLISLAFNLDVFTQQILAGNQFVELKTAPAIEFSPCYGLHVSSFGEQQPKYDFDSAHRPSPFFFSVLAGCRSAASTSSAQNRTPRFFTPTR